MASLFLTTLFSRSIVTLTGLVSFLTAPVLAQITPAPNTTGTTVETVNNQFNIGGGQLSGDGRNLFHLFRDFNVQQGQTANFLSTPQIHNILAGVNGGSASYINGLLQVTGGNSNLYLLNPAGIVFGPNAQLNLPAAFHASTAQRVHFSGGIFDLNGSNSYTQLNSSPLGFEFASKGILINEGNLRVNAGQSLTLMAHQVINTGTLGAAGGTVNVVAVPESGLVRVSQEGMLLSLEIPQERLPAAGIIQPTDLPTLLTGGNGYPAVNSVIQNADGTIRLVHDSTKIPLTTNTAVIGGTIDVSHAAGAGGKITIAGQGSNIALINAQLNAAGNAGGGTILVGGDYLGGTTGTNRLDRSFNAENLFVNSGTSLNADALSQGNGGTIINWADNSTRFYGQISARGGGLSGNGGFVEVSGKQYLDFQGTVDTTAPNGTTGTLLLDPTDIYIVPTGSDDNITSSSPFQASPSSASVSTLTLGTLLSALNSSNVIVTTASSASSTGDIYVQTPISSSSTNSLTLQADNNIIIGHPISLQGNLTLQAQGLIQNDESQNNPINISAASININSPIKTKVTDIILQSGNDIVLSSSGDVLDSTGGLSLIGANITVQSNGGTIFLGGSVRANAGIIQFDGNTNLLNSTDFLGSNVTFNGDISGNYPLSINVSGFRSSSSGNLTVLGTIDTESLAVRATGKIQLNNVIASSKIDLENVFESRPGVDISANSLRVTQSGGLIRVFAADSIFLGNVESAGGRIGIFARPQPSLSLFPPVKSLISIESINSNGGTIYLSAPSSINVGDVTTGGGDFEAASASSLEIGNINAFGTGSGGTIFLIANREIITGDILTNGGSFFANTNSSVYSRLPFSRSDIDSLLNGSRRLSSSFLSTITINNRTLVFYSISNNDTIGKLTLGNIRTNGGNVNLISGNLAFDWINAGAGSVEISARNQVPSENSLRALETFTFNGVPTSILGRSVNIFINNDTPFLVGDPALNGTAGAIQSENSIIAPLRTLSGIVQVGNIRFENRGPTLPIESPSPIPPIESPGPNPPIESPSPIPPIESPGLNPPIESPSPVPPIESPGPNPPIESPSPVPPIESPGPNPPIESPSLAPSSKEFNPLLQPPPPVTYAPLQLPPESSPILLTTEIEIALANDDLSRALTLLDQRACEQVTSYFGRPCDRSELSIEDLQAALNEIAKQTGKKPAVIYTLARPDQLDLMMVTPEGEPIHVPVRGVGREQLLKTVDQFTNSVRDPRLVNTRAYLPASQQLYQWLIAPLRSQLDAQGVETLVFVLDSGMRGIPVAALHDGQGFLIERFSMALVPSMSLMDTRYRSVQQARILAMGASEFKDQSPLPAVPVELAQITKDLGGGTEFLNADFTIPNLERQHRQGTYQIIHLATHGEFQPGSPENSYIAFTDGRLNLLQLRNLRLYRPETELLTLSACRTAVGDLDAELGFAGLSVQSGVKSVLASLWYVSDEGTLALMTGFYNQLNTAPIKAEALRQAQLAMLRGDITVKGNELRTIRGGIPLPPEVSPGDRSLSHPYFWAAFTMIGSPW